MSELRRNPLTHAWVVIAGGRSGRPGEYAPSPARASGPARRPGCPFCPGNEEQTPATILALPGPRGDGWAVRVVENAYPALTLPPPGDVPDGGPLLSALAGAGAHEVVIECPGHASGIPDREPGEVELLVEAYLARYRALVGTAEIAYVSIFKNQGKTAGASLEHPHSQILALPLVPEVVERRSEIAAAHHESTGRCLLCDVVAEELRAGTRVVHETAGFVTFAPYAPEFPGETWIVPKAHRTTFAYASGGDLGGLAEALRDVTGRMRDRFGDPDFNYAIHSPAADEQAAPHQHWFVQVSPRTMTLAGAELATGIRVCTESPEDSAERLRGG